MSDENEKQAICRSCGHGPWTLRKSRDEYENGQPRCADPDCRSRSVVLVDPGDEPIPAIAFSRFRAGESPADLVVDGVCGPERAEALGEQFVRMDDYEMLASSEIEERIEAAREEVEEAVRRKANEKISELRERNEQLQDQLDKEFGVGYKKGQMEAEVVEPPEPP